MNGARYRRGNVLIGLVTAGFVLAMLLDVVSVGSNLLEIRLLERAAAGGVITDDEAMFNDLRQGALGLAHFGLNIFIVVMFCMWVYRANKNARALGAQGMEYTPGWTVGWFFIPIANLWKPYQAIHQVWRASDPLADPRDPSAWEQSPNSALVGGWWAAWVVTNVAANVAMRVTAPTLTSQPTIEELLTSSWVSLGSDAVDIPAALLALLVSRGLYRRLELKAAAVHEFAAADAGDGVPPSPVF